MARKRIKEAKARVIPTPVKAPKAVRAGEWDGSKPRFTFAKIDLDGPWSCLGCEPGHLDLLLRKLRDFESMTWHELHRPGAHSTATPIPVDSLPAPAQRRLVEIGMDDIDGLEELHLGGLPRLWGIRAADGWFVFLWWDATHNVCPSRKTHT